MDESPDYGAVGAPPKPGTLYFAWHVMLAALKEVGIGTAMTVDHDLVGGRDCLKRELDHDPKSYWRAMNLGYKAIGRDESTWEEWCQWHRDKKPETIEWLDRWGAP